LTRASPKPIPKMKTQSIGRFCGGLLLAAGLSSALASTAIPVGSEPIARPAIEPTSPFVDPVVKPLVATATAPAPTSLGKGGLRLNFRNVPLEMVLSYLSDAAGFIVIQEATVTGNVDVWSGQPLNQNEAVALLDTVLKAKGFAAIRAGRALTIVSREEAKKRNLPVNEGSEPAAIPTTDQMVTQIIPIKHATAAGLLKDLQPLLPTIANLTANESANALVLTDTQASVHRMAEIVQALDTSIAKVSTIRVFALRFADAKDLASAVKELFEPAATTGQGGSSRAQGANRFAGGGFPGGPGGPGGGFPGFPGGPGSGGGTTDSDNGAGPNNHVVAVVDERSNSLIVSAPADYIPAIETLVHSVDVNVADIQELRVFHLDHADPPEMVDMLASLFPDDTKSGADSSGQGFRFNGGGPPGFFGQGAAQTSNNPSDRAKRKGRVLAVADPRTSSIVVSAASEMMPQIAQIIARLDGSPAKKQRVYVYDLHGADPQQTQQLLADMFQKSTSQSSRSSASQTSALTQRMNRSTQSSGGAGGSSGFGSSGAGGQSGGGRTQ